MTTPEPVLLDVTRGGVIESRHRGVLVLLAADGAVQTAAGPVDAPIFARSSLKPLQAVAMLDCGLQVSASALAMAAGSHSGEDVHRAGVRATLAAAGLTAAALRCPPDLPLGHDAMLAWVAAGGVPERICHNCSGKHAAMLATCVARDWDTASYLSLDHPLQASISAHIERLAGERIAATSVDGCGAPAHAVSPVALARAFATLTTGAASSAEGTVAAAMRAHPLLVGGTGRAVTELTAAVPGLVCKEGAEAVWAAALPDGRAFAAKVSDGSARALPPLLAGVLRHWGFDGPAVRRWSAPDMLGGGAPVGAITPSDELRALLDL